MRLAPRIESGGGCALMSTLVLEYYEAAFSLIHATYAGEIEAALLEEPLTLRRQFLLARLPTDATLPPDTVWPVARELLDELEVRLATLISRHSLFFWLHLYRRIGVGLHYRHSSNTDPRTVGLVRQIVELALQKYSQIDHANELSVVSHVNPDRVLGGWMRRGIMRAAPSRPRKYYKDFSRRLKDTRQWVVRQFSSDDIVDLYRIEGLAYAYWQVSAMMRSVGKGVPILVSDNGDWRYRDSKESEELINRVDRRTEIIRSDRTLLGTWVDGEAPGKSPDTFLTRVICPVYNIQRTPLSKYGLDIGVDGRFVPNFLIGSIDLNAFHLAHAFMSEPFARRYGYRLSSFFSVLWALGNICIAPAKVLFADSPEEAKRVMDVLILNMLSRGYRVFDGGGRSLGEEVQFRFEMYRHGEIPTKDELGLILQRLTLAASDQPDIGLWSGGPRYLILRSGNVELLDLRGLPGILETLFLSVAYDQGSRGSVFEDAFRGALETRGFKVQSGELVTKDGHVRELDAGVLIEGTLVVFECVTIERPLDYEIGKPKTIAWRIRRIEAKVEQALSLAQFVRENPVGRNYDFSQVHTVVPVVASPFVEWLWDTSERLWISDDWPRVMSADEAMDYVQSLSR